MEALPTEVVDDGTKRDSRGRRIMARDRVRALMREYKASGMTQAEFARRTGVNYPTFAGWVQRSRKAKAEESIRPAEAGVHFAEVRLPSKRHEGGLLSVELPGGLVLRGAEVEKLAALVRALQG